MRMIDGLGRTRSTSMTASFLFLFLFLFLGLNLSFLGLFGPQQGRPFVVGAAAAAAAGSAAGSAATEDVGRNEGTRAAGGGSDYGPPLIGTVDAVYDLMDRVLKDPGAKDSFRLRIVSAHQSDVDGDDGEEGSGSSSTTTTTTTQQQSWFRLEQRDADCPDADADSDADTTIVVTATSASELTAGLGYYFKHYCNFTLEWSTGGRAGGSHIVLPERWPVPLGPNDEPTTVVRRHRTTRLSYLMNVCTHSYSLVWHDRAAWQSLIDNMALRGINTVLALTGQEEIQYRVFTKLGLDDRDIRSWFNGPALLTWSRGQNEYGSGIAGPLPPSFMKSQWALQRDFILPRLRSLGMVGVLPAFQGNVPVQLAALYHDANITEEGDTGWIDALDPLFAQIADAWMAQLIEDFGTDHYYQLDGWFNGGVPPWRMANQQPNTNANLVNANLANHEEDTVRQERQRQRRAIATATADADADVDDQTRVASVVGSGGLLRGNLATSALPPHDDDWYRRGRAAYAGLNRTDPDAHWMYQGFAFVGWDTDEQASYVKGFVESAPHGKFVVIDMGYSPDGEWQKWANASFFGAPFIWTKLHNFGDTSGMRGDLHNLNWAFPHQALAARSSIIGIGGTPEGIDQNPIYYDFLYEQNFRTDPVANLTSHLIGTAHRRYGVRRDDRNIALAWTNLLNSSYSQDFSVQDPTGVKNLNPSASSSLFEIDRSTPKPLLCNIFNAWKNLIDAGDNMEALTDPFLYDLVDVGREVLAQLTVPMALNFSDARSKDTMEYEELVRTGESYIHLLLDLDRLLGTNIAFLLSPWLEAARRLAQEDATGETQNDCFSPILANYSDAGSCLHFYEFNARTQITTWNPTPHDAHEVPPGPIDYAGKHWSGLIREYYAPRAKILLRQAVQDQQDGQPLNSTTVDRLFAVHAYQWTTSTSNAAAAAQYKLRYSRGDKENASLETLEVSKEMLEKYSHWFKACYDSPLDDRVINSEI